jgi:hypothetical protein
MPIYLLLIRMELVLFCWWWEAEQNQFCPDPACRLSAFLYDLYDCCVYSQKLMMDRGTILKHVEFYSKNKFERLVHLVGFIIRIYHDAQSPERQIYMRWLSIFCYVEQNKVILQLLELQSENFNSSKSSATLDIEWVSHAKAYLHPFNQLQWVENIYLCVEKVNVRWFSLSTSFLYWCNCIIWCSQNKKFP